MELHPQDECFVCDGCGRLSTASLVHQEPADVKVRATLSETVAVYWRMRLCGTCYRRFLRDPSWTAQMADLFRAIVADGGRRLWFPDLEGKEGLEHDELG